MIHTCVFYFSLIHLCACLFSLCFYRIYKETLIRLLYYLPMERMIESRDIKHMACVERIKQLEEEIASWAIPRFTQKLILDFSGVEYISSAGIRVLLSAQKKMKEDHKMIIRNPSPFCKQIFEITGADIFLKIEGSAN